MLVAGSELWREMPLFRDYLRAHLEVAREYERLKRELAQQHQEERERYTAGKTAFVRATLERAREWDARGRNAPSS
jgi:GrpB-like predicted nucleotidyltransferase (UPF0157 family)